MVDKVYFCILLILNHVGLCAFKEKNLENTFSKELAC